jgi:speckle-type POZ protein
MKSECIQEDGSFTFCCKIFTHVEIISLSPADPAVLAFDCTGGLSTHFDGLFNSMQFSDVIFKVRGCEFPAHKNILAARSEVFAAMFQHPMEEKSTNLAKIEDIEPEVFNQLLRFIYTGRVQVDKLETMAARLFIAADKYLLDELKNKCENYLLRHMSPENCVVLLLTGDLQNPSMMLMNAAKYFRRFPNEVMATDQWKIKKQENLAVLCKIHEFVHSHK